MTDRNYILAPQTVTVSVALEPAVNAFNTLSLLADATEVSGLGAWVTQLKDTLPADLLWQHRLVFDGLYPALYPRQSYPGFPAYIDALAVEDPATLRERALSWAVEGGGLSLDTLLADREAYLTVIERVIREKHAAKDDDFVFGDEMKRLHSDLFTLFSDPPQLQVRVIAHLRRMWAEYLKPEWERALPSLHESVDAFGQINYGALTPLEAIRTISGRDLTGKWDPTLKNAQHLVFVPSAHMGPYVSWIKGDSVDWIIFGARIPEGVSVASPALTRAELLVRLSALADDTRLQILELLVEHDELCAQDIMTRLDLSQSSASRHLRQLTATGFLLERRREIAKCYSLNPARFEDTLRGLQRFVPR